MFQNRRPHGLGGFVYFSTVSYALLVVLLILEGISNSDKANQACHSETISEEKQYKIFVYALG